MIIFRGCLIFFIIIFAAPTFAAEINNIKTYQLPNRDTLTIAQISLLAYQAEFKITRQRISDNKVTNIPLRMEKLDDNSQLKIMDRVNFVAVDNPQFEPETGRLEFGNKDGYVATYTYDYRLINNTFKLLKVMKSEFVNCNDKTDECKDTKQTVIFNAVDKNAPSH